MTERPRPVTDAELVAFADGRLAPADRARVEAWLADNPAKAAEMAHWQRQNDALNALFPAIANESLPARLDPQRIAAKARLRWPQLAAAALVLLALGAGVGWAGRSYTLPSPRDLLIDHALVAHALYVKEKRHAVEVAAAERDHMVTWLSSRIERQIDSPDLTVDGFNLVGGPLLPPDMEVPTGPAAQLMFENATGERLTIYVTGPLPDGADAYEFISRNGVSAYYWADSTITCTVTAALPEEQLHTVAKKVFQQLSLRPDGA